MVLLKVELSLI